jgi:hypothetical protein
MYPLYKWGWKVLSVLIAYMVGTEIWMLVVALQNEYKAARLLM